MAARHHTTGFCSATMLSIGILSLLSFVHEIRSEALNLAQCDGVVERTDGVVCYLAVDTQDQWKDAQLVCNSKNMTLAEILTERENSAVLSVLARKNMVDSWLSVVQSKDSWRWLDDVELSYQGCFLDNRTNPDLEYSIEFPTDNSVSKCVNHCRNLSYAYASVEARTECHCGSEFGRYGQEGVNCEFQCPGNLSESCGGVNSQQVYAVHGAYSNWLGGQPNNNAGYQSCATIDSTTQFQWQDVFCRDNYRALCEIAVVNGSCSSPEAVRVNGRCLMTIDSELNFFKARYACRSHGGDLVMHLGVDDTQAITRWLESRTTTSSSSSSVLQYYVGLVKWAWKWQTGNEFLYTNWKYDQPTGPDLNCVTIKRDAKPGEWAVIGCDTSHLYICQKSNATLKVTAPSFTLAPTTVPLRTAPPPLPTTPGSSPMATVNRTAQLSPNVSLPSQKEAPANIGAIVGGSVAGGISFLIIVFVVITVCVISSRKKSQPQTAGLKKEAPSSEEMSPPTYFFGIETTSKYRNEKRFYPALPDFDDKKAGSTVGRQKSARKSMSPTSDVLPPYASMTGTSPYSNPATPYSSDIFINPELSY